jgi:hypothetical protein
MILNRHHQLLYDKKGREIDLFIQELKKPKKHRILKRIHHSVIKFDNNSEFIAGRDEKTEY